MSIPIITTERLTLRGYYERDIDAVTSIYSDEDFLRYITTDGKPYTRALAWRTLCTFAGHWSLRGYGKWAVEEKSSGELIGFVGAIYPEGWPGQEVSWSIAKSHWGKGYATEAARAAMDYVANTLRWPHVIHLIHPNNSRSIALAEKLGSKRENTWLFNGVEILVYGQDLNAS